MRRGLTIGELEQKGPEFTARYYQARDYVYALIRVGVHFGDLVKSLQEVMTLDGEKGKPYGTGWDKDTPFPHPEHVRACLDELKAHLEKLVPPDGDFGDLEMSIMQTQAWFDGFLDDAREETPRDPEAVRLKKEYRDRVAK